MDRDGTLRDESDEDPPWVNAGDPFGRHVHAIRLGKSGDTRPAEKAFEAADRGLEAFPWRLNVARRLVAEAALKDSWGHPVAWLTEAASFFESAGHGGLASACKGLLRRAGVVVPRRGRGRSPVPEPFRVLGLTSREIDVLDLVGEGLSNNDIAQRLYISVRTVESHVTSVMRKTGVDSRPQLVARLAAEREGRG